MATATLGGTVIAQSDDTKIVEGNHYFPPDSVSGELFTTTDHHTHCPWKGDASYYTIEVDGVKHENAAWFYPDPKADAAHIKDHVAFYPVVSVTT
ncbi:DUF427 domain-containing protein [Euzebya tangerina]|uniref:DUF427 domain-containing protein n=1 Tax=Euzebya tangerina TaxID=591198 RepID=UPI000E31093D|nr:DUF427 domain-containing protein [Euzebya tangerina]